MDNLVSVFLVRPGADACSDADIESLDLKLESSNFKEVAWLELGLRFGGKLGVNGSLVEAP